MWAWGFCEISRGILEISWLMIYWYYAEQVGIMEKGAGKRALGFGVTFGCLISSVWIPPWLSWVLAAGVLVLYDLFFDSEPFKRQWWRMLLPGLVLAGCALLPVWGLWGTKVPAEAVFLCHGPVLLAFLLLLSKKRESLQLWNGILTVLSFSAVTADRKSVV